MLKESSVIPIRTNTSQASEKPGLRRVPLNMVGIFSRPYISLYDKESLLKIIINNYSKDEYRNKFDNDKSSLHHSFLDDNNKDFEKVDYYKIGLVKAYNEIFDNFCYNTLKTNGNFSWKYSIQNYTASGKNQFLRPHSHLPFADFATVHYIQFDNKRHEKKSDVTL